MTDCPSPGIYPAVPYETYKDWPAVNNTLLGWLNKSPKHARAHLDGKLRQKKRDHFETGTLIHGGVLEPLQIARRYVVMPDYTQGMLTKDGKPASSPKATTQYKDKVAAFTLANADKIVVEDDEYNDLLGVAESIAADPVAGEWLRTGGKAEVCIIWNDPATGLRCKSRIDYLSERTTQFLDLKTTRNAKQFEKYIEWYDYDRQVAFYHSGLKVLTGEDFEAAIIAAETDPPYCSRSAPVGRVTMESGRKKFQGLLELYAECAANYSWPGYESPVSWETSLDGSVANQSMVEWFNQGAELLGVSDDGN